MKHTLHVKNIKISIKVSKIMLIMRGLPGSGKSFLVKQIKLKYPQVSIDTICTNFCQSRWIKFKRIVVHFVKIFKKNISSFLYHLPLTVLLSLHVSGPLF